MCMLLNLHRVYPFEMQ